MMKKSKWIIITVLILSFIITGCSNELENAEEQKSDPNTSKPSNSIDVDLTSLSSTIVYSEVFSMILNSDDYVGKKIKVKGQMAVQTDEATDKTYFAVIVADAAGCCQQGLEFVWEGDHSYPDDYLPEGSEIEITGVFRTYEENGQLYSHLITDSIIAN